MWGFEGWVGGSTAAQCSTSVGAIAVRLHMYRLKFKGRVKQGMNGGDDLVVFRAACGQLVQYSTG